MARDAFTENSFEWDRCSSTKKPQFPIPYIWQELIYPRRLRASITHIQKAVHVSGTSTWSATRPDAPQLSAGASAIGHPSKATVELLGAACGFLCSLVAAVLYKSLPF